MLQDYENDALKAGVTYKGVYIEVTGFMKLGRLLYWEGRYIKNEYVLIGVVNETSPMIQCIPSPDERGFDNISMGESVTVVGRVGNASPAHGVFRLPSIVMWECTPKVH